MPGMDLLKNKTLQFSIAAVLLLLIGYGFGKYSQPSKIVEQQSEVSDKKTNEHDSAHIVTTVVTKPDGTKETTTTEDDTKDINADSKVVEKSSEQITNEKPNWRVNALAAIAPNNSSNFNPTYGLQVERRILGPISVGIFGLTNTTVGLSLGIEF